MTTKNDLNYAYIDKLHAKDERQLKMFIQRNYQANI